MMIVICIIYRAYPGSNWRAADAIRGEESSKGDRQKENEEIQERGSWSRSPAFGEAMQPMNMDDDGV